MFGIEGARPHFVLIRYTPPRAVLHFLPLNKYAHCLIFLRRVHLACAAVSFPHHFSAKLSTTKSKMTAKLMLVPLWVCVIFIGLFYNNTHTVYHINRLSVFRPVAEALFLKTHCADGELDGPVVFVAALTFAASLRPLFISRFLMTRQRNNLSSFWDEGASG
jgi:hypothetical protein